MQQVVEIPVVAEPAPAPDFYFTCSVTKCTLRASACEKNRKEASRVDSLILTKQSTKCKHCKTFNDEQQATAISIEDYHRTVLSDATSQVRTPYVRSNFAGAAEWEGRGRSKTRLNT